jgi:hypothetical protein
MAALAGDDKTKGLYCKKIQQDPSSSKPTEPTKDMLLDMEASRSAVNSLLFRTGDMGQSRVERLG